MVKKIDNNKGGGLRGTKSLDATKGVQASDRAKSVGQVKGAKTASGTEAVSEQLRITSENRDQLYALIGEEADRLFKSKHLTLKDRQAVEKALKMIVDANILDGDS